MDQFVDHAFTERVKSFRDQCPNMQISLGFWKQRYSLFAIPERDLPQDAINIHSRVGLIIFGKQRHNDATDHQDTFHSSEPTSKKEKKHILEDLVKCDPIIRLPLLTKPPVSTLFHNIKRCFSNIVCILPERSFIQTEMVMTSLICNFLWCGTSRYLPSQRQMRCRFSLHQLWTIHHLRMMQVTRQIFRYLFLNLVKKPHCNDIFGLNSGHDLRALTSSSLSLE